MEIKWIGEERMIPNLGILQAGDIREVSDKMGTDLIRQGLAVKSSVKDKKSDTGGKA